MADTINSFLNNIDLSELNSLTHLLDDDDDFNDVGNSLKQSFYCTEEEIAEFCNPSNHPCNIVSLNCQSLHSKFQYIKILYLITFRQIPVQFKYCVFKRRGSLHLQMYLCTKLRIII